MAIRTAMAAAVLAMAACTATAAPPADSTAGRTMSGNPILPGWYADPEAAVFGKTYWIYPTTSRPYAEQVAFDAFSSPDLVHWT